MKAIAIERVRHHFGEKEVLKGITLSADQGEIIGLLGPSGAGKTTLIKIITGQLTPSEGSVLLAGYDMSHPSGEVYREIGMMRIFTGLMPTESERYWSGLDCMRTENIWQRSCPKG